MSTGLSRRQEALRLAEELLRNVELSELPPTDLARKASRLARLLDDVTALEWLRREIGGYDNLPGEPNTLGHEAWAAAVRSNRTYTENDGIVKARTQPLGQLQASIDAGMAQIAAAVDRPVSVSSANPNQFVSAGVGNTQERGMIRNFVGEQSALRDKVVGTIYAYVADRYQELRFGSAVETAFETVRKHVDAEIASLVPEALPKLSAAFENAASDNPEQWANAAAGCRRLLQAAADALRPPGPDVNNRKMGPDQYLNRLAAWVEEQSASDTTAELIVSDLEYLGRRLGAVLDAGHKGAHADVNRLDASRYVTGTYLLLGDILRLRPAEVALQSDGGRVADLEEPGPLDVHDQWSATPSSDG